MIPTEAATVFRVKPPSPRSEATLVFGVSHNEPVWSSLLLFSHGSSFQFDSVCIVYEPVEDGVGQRGVAHVVVPELEGKLAGDDGGGAAVAVLEDLQEIPTIAVAHGGKSQVIDEQDVDLGDPGKELAVAAVGAGQGELLEETGAADVEGAVAFAAGLVGQGAGDEGLAHARGAGDQDVSVMADPVAGGQPREHGAVDAAWCPEVDVLDAGRQLEPGGPQIPLHPGVLLPVPLAIDEQAEALGEAQGIASGLLELFLEGVGHAVEFQGVEFFEGLVVEHARSFQL